MKKKYMKLSMKVFELHNKTCLLQASGTPPNEIPDYDDWFGSRRASDGRGRNVWDDDEDLNEGE